MAQATGSCAGDAKRRKKEDSSGVTLFIWDEENVVQETDGSGVVQAQYTD